MKPAKNIHTSKSQKGSGDYYGSGIKQKVGTMRSNYLDMPIKNKLKTKPKNLA